MLPPPVACASPPSSLAAAAAGLPGGVLALAGHPVAGALLLVLAVIVAAAAIVHGLRPRPSITITRQDPSSRDAVIVSRASVESKDVYDIIDSNIAFVNALFREHLRADEIAPDAMRSYYVDFYLAQVQNGGFAQLVYNSGWRPAVIAPIREGLAAMDAREHLALFEEGAALVERLGTAGLEAYLRSPYFGEHAARERLDAVNARFFDVQQREDLVVLNAAWLMSLPHLVAMTPAEMEAEVARRGAALPDREQRIATARAAEPRHMKLIRALCRRRGLALRRVTGGDPTHVHEGARTMAWHFLTDRGHCFMVEAGGKALLFQGDTRRCIAEIEAREIEGS